jgi:glycosyltransferase involved in cell wall biosynthesis
MPKRPRVLLLIPHLGGGGAEQVTALLGRHLSAAKYEVHLGLVTQSVTDSTEFPASLQRHALGAQRVRSATWPLLKLIWAVQPDVILSGIFHLNFLVLLLRPLFPGKTGVLVRQNGTASQVLAGQAFLTRLLYRWLYRWLYRRADRIVCQTAAMALDLENEIHLPPNLMVVLPNPVDVETLRKSPQKPLGVYKGPGPHLLAVGRLSREKGLDLLLLALARVRSEGFPGIDLAILGSGPEEHELKKLCGQLELESAVHFSGWVENPSDYLAGATVYVQPSRHEGLPNALLEAAATGLPLVATPCTDGLVELLREQPGVWLAEAVSAESLAAALRLALQASQTAPRLEHRFIEGFRLDRAISGYEGVLDSVLQESTPETRLD